jgi:hypothetical protein
MKNNYLAVLFTQKVPVVITVIFHPLIMPTLGTLVLFHSGIPVSFISANSKNIILAIIALCTFFIPLAFIPFFYLHSFSKLIYGENQHRFLPLLLVFISYYAGFYILNKMQAPSIIQVFMMATIIAVFLTLIINLFWKISAHMVGIGGVVGLIIMVILFYEINMAFYLISAILVSGATGSSRLSLNAHTPKQVYFGFLMGLLVTIGMFILV